MAQIKSNLKELDILVGKWKISGGAEGTVTFEWMEGGFFLLQHVDLEQDKTKVKGIEYIGHLKSFDGVVSKDIHSRYYDTMGNTFDYVYELRGKTLTIWAGEKNSPAYYKGTFSDDNNSCTGDWVYPGGGGYSSAMTRIK